jgi:hypothetical protein
VKEAITNQAPEKALSSFLRSSNFKYFIEREFHDPVQKMLCLVGFSFCTQSRFHIGERL